MDAQAASAAVNIVGSVAALGLFLPGIDKAWGESPDPANWYRLRLGEAIYLGAVLAVTATASAAHGSAAPLVLGMGLALLIVAAHEYALRQPKKQEWS